MCIAQPLDNTPTSRPRWRPPGMARSSRQLSAAAAPPPRRTTSQSASGSEGGGGFGVESGWCRRRVLLLEQHGRRAELRGLDCRGARRQEGASGSQLGYPEDIAGLRTGQGVGGGEGKGPGAHEL